MTRKKGHTFVTVTRGRFESMKISSDENVSNNRPVCRFLTQSIKKQPRKQIFEHICTFLTEDLWFTP